MRKIDLHTHSTVSDGTDAPSELLALGDINLDKAENIPDGLNRFLEAIQ